MAPRLIRKLWQNDYLVVLGADGVLGLLGLVSGVLVARSVGSSGRGVLAAVVLWIGMTGAVGTIGVPYALTYYSGRTPGSRGFLWRLGLQAAVVQGLLFGAIALVLVPLILSRQGAQAAEAARWFALSVPVNLLVGFQLAVIQGSGGFRLWSALRVSQAAAYVSLLSVWWLTTGVTVERALLAQLLSTSAMGLLAAYHARTRFGDARNLPTEKFPWALYLYGLPSLLAIVSTMTSTQVDQLVLTVTVPERELGLYAVAVSLSMAMLPVASAVSSVAITHMAKAVGTAQQSKTARKSIGMVFAVLAVAGVVCAVLAEWVVVILYGEAFRAASVPLRLLALAAPFLGAGQVATAVLRGAGRPGLAAAGEVVAAGVTVGMLVWLLPTMGILGAAVASLTAYCLSFVIQMLSIRRKLQIPLRDLLIPFGRSGFGPRSS